MADKAAERPKTYNDPKYPQGVVVSFGTGERTVRVASLQAAITEGSRQRRLSEPFALWDGAVHGKEGAKPLLDVADGESVEEAKKRRS